MVNYTDSMHLKSKYKRYNWDYDTKYTSVH